MAVNRVVTFIGSEERKTHAAVCRRHGADRPLPRSQSGVFSMVLPLPVTTINMGGRVGCPRSDELGRLTSRPLAMDEAS
jgi:hypothetical protein